MFIHQYAQVALAEHIIRRASGYCSKGAKRDHVARRHGFDIEFILHDRDTKFTAASTTASRWFQVITVVPPDRQRVR